MSIYNFEEEIAKYGLTVEQYEKCLKDINDKVTGKIDLDWSEIIDKYDLPIAKDTLRKASSQSLFGNVFVSEYLKWKKSIDDNHNDDSYIEELEALKREIQKERQKLNATKVEYNRNLRHESRFELFYENIRDVTTALPLPEFYPIYSDLETQKEYVLGIADIHAGAKFESENNSYSLDECKNRFQILLGEVIDFVKDKKLSKIKVVELGDTVQGILRLSDLRLNETSVVEATVFISRVIAQFLNELSAYCYVDYYHVPTANHSQTRPLGSKASELATEDVEYVISNYIKDLTANNERISVTLNNGKEYVKIPILNFECIAMHGHRIKKVENALKDLSHLHRTFYDYVFLGHFHVGKELPVGETILNDMEVVVCPSFVGSDPYSDSLMKGTKSACKIYGFDDYKGLTETYKFILN